VTDIAGAKNLREVFARLGVTESELAVAAEDGTLLLLAVDRLVFDDQPKLATEQMLEVTPLDPDRTAELWRSLGFADPPEGELFFTDADMEILAVLASMVESGATDPDLLVQMTRVAGQSMARFAAAQVELMVERSAELSDVVAAQVAAEHAASDGAQGPEPITWKAGAGAATQELSVIDAPRLAEDLDAPEVVDPEVRQRTAEIILDSPAMLASVVTTVPAIPQLLEYVWRRHMQAAARNRLLHGGPESGKTLAVGFADLVGFTSLSQQISTTDLSEVVERFERIAYDTVARLGGRVIKMIGDEVMFSVDDPRRAIEVGLELAATYREDDELSDVRVGISWGKVLQREGDCFGPVVNRASRVVNIAFPGSVVVSDEVHELLQDDPELAWHSLRRKNLKDIGRVVLWSVQRADAEDAENELRDRARAERSERVERAVERITSSEVLSKEARQARRDALRRAKRDAEERARRAKRDIEERAREALRSVDDQARRAKREVEEQAKLAKQELEEQTRLEIEAHEYDDEGS
jgi:adenylate cyclase